MVAAIEDGTLVPGERLSDDELTAWLGVSRTPVREAIARLVAEGFVEMAANRYTKISSLSATEYGYASDFLSGLHQLTRERANTLSAAARKHAATASKKLTGAIAKHDLAAYRGLLDLYGSLTTGLGNPLITEAERSARGRAKFHAASPDVAIDWQAAAEQAAALAKL